MGEGMPWYVLVLYILILGGGMYLLLIRPQKKKQKQEEKMRNSLQVGDEIVTIGGVFGRIVAVKEDAIVIESGPDRSKLQFAKWCIQQNLTVHDEEETEPKKGKSK